MHEQGILASQVHSITQARVAARSGKQTKIAGDEIMEQVNMQRQDNSVTEELIAERRLWTAVIVHAVEEWLSGPLRLRRAAQKFIFEEDHDFKQVCSCAGIDPASFRSELLRIGRRVEMKGPLAHPIAA